MKALVLFAQGFEEVEAITPVDFLRRGGLEVTAASIHDSLDVSGAHNISVKTDALLSKINPDDYGVVILPGGYDGMLNLGKSQNVVALLKKFAAENKWIAAICAAPSILGDNGLVKGKKCACYPGFEEHLTGGLTSQDQVVVDGNIITSRGPGTAIPFALKILEVVVNKETSQDVGEDTLYL
ncbi:MAG: DJ-1/PfpI family protein [Anaerovibrio sp.]|uniref:DJ-1 family glyoxalase III n=1 Tax=Anaerovibrio sp. TaxID=1872532 RepID=UPI0025E9A22F|nr:DJ-1 family glyoxalase III [Anaerovibrio sp.]MCR5175323.1 DJ-1/PfpI family protein [Anaerovibrio sp.]